MDKFSRPFLVLASAATIFLFLKFAVPLFANYFAGLGVDIPLRMSQTATALLLLTLGIIAGVGLLSVFSRRPKTK